MRFERSSRNLADTNGVMMAKFLRVIVPVFNGGKRFAETMYKSIVAQTMQDFHLIVVNDASTDDTADILRGLNRVDVVVTNNENRLAGGSRNVGADYYKHDEYTLFLDDDDKLWDDQVFERIRECANGKPELIRLNYHKWSVGKPEPTDAVLNERIPTEDTPRLIAEDYTRLMPWNICVRTDKLVPFPEGLTLDDGIWGISQCDVCETASVVPQACYEWICRDGSLTTPENRDYYLQNRYMELALLYKLKQTLEHEWARHAAENRIAWAERMVSGINRGRS